MASATTTIPKKFDILLRLSHEEAAELSHLLGHCVCGTASAVEILGNIHGAIDDVKWPEDYCGEEGLIAEGTFKVDQKQFDHHCAYELNRLFLVDK